MLRALGVRELRHISECHEKVCTLKPHPAGFALFVGDAMVCGDADPRYLTKCAFASGAREVDWPFDFKGWD